jgi:Flp pilus assembly protein TadD
VDKGDLNEGIAELETAVRLSEGNPRFLAYLGYADAVSGKRREAHDILNKLESLARQQYVSPVGIATIHMGLGEREAALSSLEKAYLAHESELTGITTDHRLDLLHSDPRFQDLVRRVGLAR